MNPRIAIFIGLLLALSAGAQTDSVVVRFEVVAPGLVPDSSVFVAGSPTEWGYWAPDGVKLDYVGNSKWVGDVQMAHPQTFEYKFTLGDWGHEAADAQGFPWANQTESTAPGLVIRDTVVGWLEGGETPKRIVGQVTGELRIYEDWGAPGLLPRDVRVWFPPGYFEQPEIWCNLLVMHDGQNVFDPATSNFGVDWAVDETLDSLIRQGLSRPVIVLAADCTENRGPEYSPGPEGKAYMDWVVNALVPWAQETFRVRKGAAHTVVAGASMGGLISFMLAEQHPEVFGAAICMSPAFAYLDFNYAEEVAGRDWPADAGSFWIDNGTVGLEEKLQGGVDQMHTTLQSLGAHFKLTIDEGGKHFEADWARRFPEAYRWVESELTRRLTESH